MTGGDRRTDRGPTQASARIRGPICFVAALGRTLNVLPLQAVKVQFDASYPGYWMIHCHILYHQAAGMQTVLHYEGFTNKSYDPFASLAEFGR